MTNLTELQFRMLDRIAHDEMTATNGRTPETHQDVRTYLWVDIWAGDLGIDKQAAGGVITSLKNAGFINVQAPSKGDPDGGCDFTEAGFDALMSERARRGLKPGQEALDALPTLAEMAEPEPEVDPRRDVEHLLSIHASASDILRLVLTQATGERETISADRRGDLIRHARRIAELAEKLS